MHVDILLLRQGSPVACSIDPRKIKVEFAVELVHKNGVDLVPIVLFRRIAFSLIDLSPGELPVCP